mmetsp:Transcript_52208/g.158605  ORF Transcript_52208/g.158605 Transcript_52208/m.158605 type:complete len:256 (-) Transcript_52208:1856-2623(-)
MARRTPCSRWYPRPRNACLWTTARKRPHCQRSSPCSPRSRSFCSTSGPHRAVRRCPSPTATTHRRSVPGSCIGLGQPRRTRWPPSAGHSPKEVRRTCPGNPRAASTRWSRRLARRPRTRCRCGCRTTPTRRAGHPAPTSRSLANAAGSSPRLAYQWRSTRQREARLHPFRNQNHQAAHQDARCTVGLEAGRRGARGRRPRSARRPSPGNRCPWTSRTATANACARRTPRARGGSGHRASPHSATRRGRTSQGRAS